MRRRVRRPPRRKVSKKSAPSFGLSFGLILQIGSIYRVSVTLQKRGLLRPMPLLHAFAHWDHETRPTAAVLAGAIHSCQGRRYFAVTSGLESRNRWPRPVLAAIQQARASCENSSNNSFTPETQTLPVNFADNQKYNKDPLPSMNRCGSTLATHGQAAISACTPGQPFRATRS